MGLAALHKNIFLILCLSLASCAYEVDELGYDSSYWEERWRKTPRYWGAGALPLSLVYSKSFEADFVEDDFDEEGLNPLEQSLLEWDSVIVNRNLFTLPLPSVTNKEYSNIEHYRDGEMGIYKHHSWFPPETAREFFDAIAVAQLYLWPRNQFTPSEHLEILHADILFNYRDYDFSTDGDSFLSHDIQSVSIHEVGHLLGFRHQAFNRASVMHPSLSTYQKRRTVGSYDRMYAAQAYDPGGSRGMGAALLGDEALEDDEPEDEEPQDGPLIRLIVALKPNGECLHYVGEDKTPTFRHVHRRETSSYSPPPGHSL